MSSATSRTVSEAMLTCPVLSSADATSGEVAAMFADEHRHAALLVDEDGVLVGVVDRTDLLGAEPQTPARLLGALEGRVVAPETDLDATRATMLARDRRRVAVVDDAGRLLGLLCLKNSRRGFCSAEDVAAR